VAQITNLSFKNRFPYYFRAVIESDEASNFKLGRQLGFFKAHYHISLKEKVGVALGYGSFPKLGASPYIFLQRQKPATSNLVHSLAMPRPIIKSHPEKKVEWPWARGAPQIFGVPL